MIYLDYSATTPVNEEVLATFNKICLEYPGNPNSLHALGYATKKIEEQATLELANMLRVKPGDIIYTSGASESNNLAIKGIALKYQNRGKHIITTMLEHASVFGPLNYLQTLGFDIDFVNLTEGGLIDIDHLKSLMRDDTILVSIAAVDSELGIRQPIEEVGLIIKEYPKCFFHSDITQAMGKVSVDLADVDLASFTAHKFYGIKGIGALIKKDKIMLEPLIHGGKSTTSFRSGTPAVPLIASMVKALSLIDSKTTEHYEYVKGLNEKLRNALSKYDGLVFNNQSSSLPFVINFSLTNIKAETFVHALETEEIYISTKSACSSSDSISKAVYAVTGNEAAASTSLRISLSYLTTEADVDIFLNVFDKKYHQLNLGK